MRVEDVLPGLGACEDPGSRVLHILEPVQGFGKEPRQAWMRVSATGLEREEREGWSLEMFYKMIKS